MSAILSADDLNDFISPGVACIKPIETLPEAPEPSLDPYEVTTEDKVAAANPPPAQISLTDCLACSGCVTSAEAVLVSLQSHNEVLHTLETYPNITPPWSGGSQTNGSPHTKTSEETEGRFYVATISPQSKASLAALLGVSSVTAGNVIAQLLAGSQGLGAGGQHGSHFSWVLDSNVFRELALVMAAEEATASGPSPIKRAILTSACPGWICYAEKTHPHVLPYLSRLKSPQALAGTMVKSMLWKEYGIPPSKVWHLAVMPCFDKKLEASRSELHSDMWSADSGEGNAVRDVDCVITIRELLSLADARGIDVAKLPRRSPSMIELSDLELQSFLFPRGRRRRRMNDNGGDASAGSSGGYLWHILQTAKADNPGSRIEVERGRNADVLEYRLVAGDDDSRILFKVARYYGFRNIQNLVRRLKPSRASRLPGAAKRGMRVVEAQGASDHAYVEVMACPGGCTNGGGQIKASDFDSFNTASALGTGVTDQKAWLSQVDEAYWSASGDSDESDPDDGQQQERDKGDDSGAETNEDLIDGISRSYVKRTLGRWSDMTGIDVEKLCYTTYKAVDSDVGKSKGKGKSDMERVAGLAVQVGGGW